MFKRFLLGAAVGVVGKNLYDKGLLMPYLDKAIVRLLELTQTSKAASPEAPAPKAVSRKVDPSSRSVPSRPKVG
jgi:hypothetical protein